MIKSGMIGAAVSLILVVGLALLSPICVPCAALFLGLGVGFLAGVLDKPADGRGSAKAGAVAGVISGIGAALGQLIGAGLNSLLVGPEDAARMLQQLGVETVGSAGVGLGYWAGIVVSGLCFSFLDVALMAGMGALGGLAWMGIMGQGR